jgi:hypothetical protein
MPRSADYKRITINGKQVPAGRALMEKMLKRPLHPWETVRFLDGNSQNVTEENLQLWVGPVKGGVSAGKARCPHCDNLLYKKPDRLKGTTQSKPKQSPSSDEGESDDFID